MPELITPAVELIPSQLPTTTGGDWDEVAAQIGQVIRKLADGTYPTEAVRCWCGADFNDEVLTHHDRFFIPHRMVLCNECCLIRATPRMTAAAYRDFYNTEYRPIYDGWQFGRRYQDQDYLFMRQLDKGVKFKEFTDHFGVHPKTVLDVGCNMGATLRPFQDEGATVYGVDVCQASTDYGRAHGLPIQTGTMADLLAQGVQADLIVMQDFIEHLLDFDDLRLVAQLLKPQGFLYVGTPGLFRWNLSTVFQNAHPYQFIGASLQYVLGQYGFDEMYLDEEITSLWRYEPDRVCTMPKPRQWKRYIGEHLAQVEYRAVPPVRSINKFPVPHLKQNAMTNLTFRRPDVSALSKTQDRPAVIVGGGPSVDGQLDTIRQLVADGAHLLVIERMYPWCATVGLHPDYVMSMDCSDGVETGFTAIQEGTIHILSSVTHPGLFTLLADAPVYLFHTPQVTYLEVQDAWREAGYTKATVINCGGSVTLGCFALAMRLGYRDVHVFGLDCQVDKEKAYATGIAGESVERHYFPVKIGDEEVYTCASFLGFARSFFHMKAEGLRSGLLTTATVYGESLVNKMADEDGGGRM